jgi:site-specific DNA-methyltransferase (adenine-specific)
MSVADIIQEVPYSEYRNSYLYNVDCMRVLPAIPDKYFDLAVVDVPYGIGQDGSKNHLRINRKRPHFAGKEYHQFIDDYSPGIEYWQELFRVSKNQIVWGANHFISKLPKQDASCWIVWDKDNGQSHFADCELAWTSFKTAVRKFKFRWNGMLQEDMKHKEIRIHPAQKPVKLYEWLLMKYAKADDKILDTHAGSGSSRIAAYRSGFYFTGFEIDRHYCQVSSERFCEEIKNLTIKFERT